ncbi:MAG TPA: zinc dependent phospholipase C family protein [Bryobacteraceae bacterium]|nr:zinc dependent phospholipase C family protein [Bryobacteraceae bacterium]
MSLGFRVPPLTSCFLIFLMACPAGGYSLLTHEAIVDALWDIDLKPLIRARFPAVTPENLKEAHAYAYGGAVLQDLGYYPHGNKFFSDLTHYVRTGQLIEALLKDAANPDEYAFALGALTHYFGDTIGHSTATNIAEPQMYPRLRRKFGNRIYYDEAPLVHVRTEFSFDVVEVSRGNFAPQAYHDFIGFSVAVPLLTRAMRETYGVELSHIFPHLDVSLGSFRYSVSKAIPTATRVAWVQRHDEIEQASPGMTKRRFEYAMRRSSYEKYWGKQYDRPTFIDRLLAVLLRILPPIGPLRDLRLKMPTPDIERLFMKSFTEATGECRNWPLGSHLPDKNLDTGTITGPGQYPLNDRAHAELLHLLAQNNFAGIRTGLRTELLEFYSNPATPIATKKNHRQWKQVLAEIEQLKKTREETAHSGF